MRTSTGMTYLTDSEYRLMQTEFNAGLEDVSGFRHNPERASFSVNPATGGFKVSTVYGPKDYGYATREAAVDNALYAFRDYGVVEDDLTVQGLYGNLWKDVDGAGGGKPPSAYQVAVDFEMRPTAEDAPISEYLEVKNNFVDRLPGGWLSDSGQGSVTQHLFDPTSVMPPHIVNPAMMSIDKSVAIREAYVKVAEKFSKGFAKQSPKSRAAINEQIKYVNQHGIPFNAANLANKFNPKEIELLKEWRRLNDILYHATNADMSRSLQGRGYGMYVHRDSNTNLVAKGIDRPGVNSKTPILNPETGATINLSKKDLDDLYDKGGSVMHLATPITTGPGKGSTHVISLNTPSKGYVKRLTDDDTVLNYREGYYPVMYEAKFFVYKELVGSGGDVTEVVVASAKTTKERDFLMAELGRRDPNSSFGHRLNKQHEQAGRLLGEDDWALMVSSGMSAQKVRGSRLQSVESGVVSANNTNLVDPLEAVAAQIHKISQRVAMRDYLEGVKKRWHTNFKDVVDIPKGSKWPNKVTQIKGKSGSSSKKVADAKSIFNYLNSLENGYVNGMDFPLQSMFNYLSDVAGSAGLGKTEVALSNLGRASAARELKTTAFKLYLSASPIRQGVVQRSQIMQLAVIDPVYFSTMMTADVMGVRAARFGLVLSPRYEKLLKEANKAGIFTAVDANTLIRDDLLRLADVSYAQKAAGVANAPIKASQKVGFDAAEQDVLLTSWLTHRNAAKSKGKNLKDVRVQEEILGQSRAFTLAMNRGGEMPYTQNTLALPSQFLSVMHKALLQTFTSRSLSKADRAKLLAWNVVMFGPGASLVTATMYSLFSKQDERELTEGERLIRDGLVDAILNKSLTEISGEDQNIDFSDLTPSDMHGTGELLVGLISNPILGMVTESPAGSLFFGNNARLTGMFKTYGQFFNVPGFTENYDHPDLKVSYRDVVIKTMSIFSGMSAKFKSDYALEQKRLLSSSGRISEEHMTSIESYALLSGFRPKGSGSNFKAMEILHGEYEESSKEDYDIWYEELKRHLATRGKNLLDDELHTKVLQEAIRVFDKDYLNFASHIQGRINADIANGDLKVLEGFQRAMGIKPMGTVIEAANALPEGWVKDEVFTLIDSVSTYMKSK